jgi:HAMP domain-containing protein
MDDWMPLEIVVLVAVAAVAAVSLCALLAWYRLRHRQIELAACTSDDQAARLLAESLAKVGATADSVAEIMTTFVRWIRPANAPWRQQSLDSSQRPTRCSG